MKQYLLFLVILIFLILPVNAARVNLIEGENYYTDGRNITVLGIDNKRDKVLVCINNERAILSKERQKTVNDVSLLVKTVSDEKIRIDIKVYCEDCECNENCLNTECIKAGENVEEEIEKEILGEIELLESFETNEEIIENPGLSAANITLALIILVLFTAGLYYLIKR
ncbi:hypothetical protein J4449_02110 [Candidatus Woesearchaeota archaeon]|nr:hypothetical protein [Candidatus Woesearchaeota archaeon]